MLKFDAQSGTIGVIGGAGVAASAELVSRIEQMVTAMGAFRDAQHPELVLYQATHAPSRSMYLEGRGDSFIPSYIEAATKLKSFGASFVAMCCNTAHVARDRIAAEAGIPVINLIGACAAKAREIAPDATRVGILCSDGARSARLFNTEMAACAATIEIVYPDPAFQTLVTRGICHIKKGFHRTLDTSNQDRPVSLFTAAALNLVDKQVDVIILGCTEVPLDFAVEAIPVPVIDSIQVLAETCIAVASGARQVE